jgi:hypothetical protein
MPSDQTFEQQLQSHVGGLVRVCYDDGGGSGLNGKIGLLMGVTTAFAASRAVVEVLIEERVRSLLLYSNELELLPADDA